jgi:hypothetical protein
MYHGLGYVGDGELMLIGLEMNVVWRVLQGSIPISI